VAKWERNKPEFKQQALARMKEAKNIGPNSTEGTHAGVAVSRSLVLFDCVGSRLCLSADLLQQVV
jgi:hypothetical protein